MEKPTKIRWNILGLIFLVSTLTFMDRVNMSIAGKYVMSEYNIDNVAMGTIFSAFVLGYACFQIPAGWVGDRLGPKKLLTFAICWWSLFTVLTAYAGDSFLVAPLGVVGAFMTVRFLIGAGEAAAYPNFNRAIANWMTPTDRAFAGGVMNAGMGFGAACTPPLVAWIMMEYGWRESFWITGLIGLVVAALWYWYVTDRPDEHKAVNAAELAIIRGDESETSTKLAKPKAAWGKILSSANVWLLVLSYTLFGYVIYVFLSWFYIYLVNVKGFSIMKGALYSTGPFIAITIMAPLGGYISDRLITKYGRRIARRSVVMSGFLLSSASILIGAAASDVYVAVFALSLGAGFGYFAVGTMWSTCTDIAKSQTGTVSGMMNTGGNLGGTLSPMLTPIIANKYGWDAAIQVTALCAFIAALLWIFIKADKEIDFSSED